MLSSNTKTAAELAAERKHRSFEDIQDLQNQLKEIREELCRLSALMSPVTTVEAAMPEASTRTAVASVFPATTTPPATAKRQSRNVKGKL